MKFLPFLCCLLLSVATQYGQSLLKPSDRVVFIGDSITGQGGNNPDGWVHLIGRGLKAAHPDAAQALVALGGSGQTVGSWLSIEKKSRSAPTILDVKGVDAQVELGQPADVVVSMLGMNDVLCPRTGNDEAGIKAWTSQYRELIRAVRARTNPRVFALATPTMCTEDPDSPKNQALKKLGGQLEILAKEENCVVLPTWESMKDVLDEGLKHRPDFHVTGDNVHPNPAGHVAIAVGMLRGLGEPDAAKSLLDSWIKEISKTSSLSYRVSHVETTGEKDRFQVSFDHLSNPAAAPVDVTLTVPEGWTVQPEKVSAASGNFTVTGIPDHLNNELLLKAGAEEAEIRIPTPWLLGTSRAVQKGWQGMDFIPAQGVLDADVPLSQGKGWGSAIELTPGKPLTWKRYFAGRAYGGEGKPGALDFAAVTYFDSFAVGYGARWIFSDSPRTINLRLLPLGFTRDNYLTVWMNAREVFSGDLKKAPPSPLAVPLDKGWNVLVFKSNHREWQWQFAIELASANGESLDSLRFRASPPE